MTGSVLMMVLRRHRVAFVGCNLLSATFASVIPECGVLDPGSCSLSNSAESLGLMYLESLYSAIGITRRVKDWCAP